MISQFILLILFRALSGVQNGLGYARKEQGLLVATVLMWAFFIGTTSFYFCTNTVAPSLSFLSCLLGVICSTCVLASFTDRDWEFADVHFWEVPILPTFMLIMYLGGTSIITLALSVYPGMILHKGAVNKGAGLPFFDNRTDDKTGKTYSIPLLGIKVPRTSTEFRIFAAVLSVLLFIIFYIVLLLFSFTVY